MRHIKSQKRQTSTNYGVTLPQFATNLSGHWISLYFPLQIFNNYLTVNAITREAITEQALTIVDTTEILYELF